MSGFAPHPASEEEVVATGEDSSLLMVFDMCGEVMFKGDAMGCLRAMRADETLSAAQAFPWDF